MAVFYKHHIMDWRSGTSGLSDRAYRVYHVIIEEIMLNDGPVPLHERSLAGKSNRSTRDFRAALAELIEAGKVILKDGFLHNPRAEAELDAMQKSREKYPKSPRKVDEKSANTPRIVRELEEKPNDFNGHFVQIREDKIREDKKEKYKKENQPLAALAEFDEFYKIYPKKVGKGQAVKAWRSAVKKASAEQIIAGLRRFDFNPDRQYVPNPATWLNGERWADETSRPDEPVIPLFDPATHQENLDRILGRTKANA